MEWTQRSQVAGCKNGNCAKVFVSGSRAFVQGTVDMSGRMTLGAGEAVVEIPVDVLLEAAKEVRT